MHVFTHYWQCMSLPATSALIMYACRLQIVGSVLYLGGLGVFQLPRSLPQGSNRLSVEQKPCEAVRKPQQAVGEKGRAYRKPFEYASGCGTRVCVVTILPATVRKKAPKPVIICAYTMQVLGNGNNTGDVNECYAHTFYTGLMSVILAWMFRSMSRTQLCIFSQVIT